MKLGFKLFTTTGIQTTEPSKANFGLFPVQQNQILKDLLWCFENLANTGKHVFHKGGIMAVIGLFKLSEIMKEDYGITDFKTSPCTIDRAEVFFSELKTIHVSYDNPNSIVFTFHP